MSTAAQNRMAIERRAESRFSAEFELLLTACKLPLDQDRRKQSLTAPISWEQFLRLVEHHRVVPTVYQALQGCDDVPASIQSALGARFQKSAVKSLRFSAELVRVVRAFQEVGIEVLAHKGPALAQLLYDDAAMRQYGDLDLLVRSKHVAQAKVVLQELGYDLSLQLTSRQEQAYLHSGYEYVFGLGPERNLVELQWQILPRFYAIDFNLDAMFGRSVEIVNEGFPLRTLAPSDLMLVLCAHGAKHGWAQIGMLRDIAALARMRVDWDWIGQNAMRLGIQRIVAMSLHLAHDLFATEIPASVALDDVGPLAGSVLGQLASGKNPEVESLSYFRDFAQWRERWRDRARFWLRLALTPSVGEWQSVRLPDWVFPLYRAVRLGRLLRKIL